MIQKIMFSAIVGSIGTAIAVPVTLLTKNSENLYSKSSSLSISVKPEIFSQKSSNEIAEKPSVSLKQSNTVPEVTDKIFDECKELGKSDFYGKLIVCRDKNNESKVKFSWYEYLVIDSVPKKIENLKFTHQELVVELEEEVGYGKSKRFDLTNEMLQNKGPISIKGGSTFEEKDCKVEWILNSRGEKIDWITHCSLNSSDQQK